MLTYNPDERISAEAALKDEWIQEFASIGKKEAAVTLK
jgi:hypothetical protein